MVLLSGGTPSPGTSITDLLSMATELFTWVITQLGSLATFITSTPIILMPFIIVLVGFIVGFWRRVWRSVKG